jgi:polyisoprenoid-binding protein YceI
MSTTATETIPTTGTWNLDPVHSTIGFEITYNAGTFRGTFREAEATYVDGVLKGSAKVSSVDVKDENLNAHLQSPDFFDAEQNPELTFVATNLAFDNGRVTADGELTIKGVTKPVTFTGTARGPVTDAYNFERIGFQVETTIDRTEFGVSWNAPLPNGGQALGNDVKIVIDAQFVKAA